MRQALERLVESLRWALSHREKAQKLLADSEAALAAGQLDAARHGALRAFYLRQIDAAKAAEAGARSRLIAEGERLRRAEADTREAQARLLAEVGAGRVGAGAANRRNRKLEQRAAAIEHEAEAVRRLTYARRSGEAGGFIDKPLNRYATGGRMFDFSLFTWKRASVVGLGVLMLAVLLFFAFLPRHAGDVRFQALGTAADSIVRIRCINTTDDDVTVAAPAPEALDTLAGYGIRLGLAEKTKDNARDADYRVFTPPPGLWRANGLPVHEPVTVASGARADFAIDLRRLAPLDLKARSVEVSFRAGQATVGGPVRVDLPR